MDDKTQDITQSADAQLDTEPLDSEPVEERERWFDRHPRAHSAVITMAVVSIVSIAWFTFATIGVMAGQARFLEAASVEVIMEERTAVESQAAKLRAEKMASGVYYPSTDAVPFVLGQGAGRIEGSGQRVSSTDETAADRQVAQTPPPPLPAPTTSEETDEADTDEAADEADTDEAADDADEPADETVPALPTTGLGPDQ